MGDFSIVNNLSANAAELNLERNRETLADTTRRLSSGLRIGSAADDPSGLAISESLQTRVDALNQSSQNVATAKNAVAVADGGLATITDILLRIRSLAVEAASTISSTGDRANEQLEITSLLHEIDRISGNTNFNGQPLLDGSHSGFVPAQNAQLVVTANSVLANNTFSTAAVVTISDPGFSSAAVPANTYVGYTSFGGWTISSGGVVYNGAPPVGPLVPLSPGQQAAALSGSGQQLTQPITVGANGTYAITFQSGLAGGPVLSDTLGVTIDGVSVGTIVPTTSLQSYSVTSNIAPGPHTLGFVYQGPSSAPNMTITGVSVTQVPVSSAVVGTPLLVQTASAANANFATTVGATPTVDGSIKVEVVNTGVSIAAQMSFIASGTGAVSVSPVLVPPWSTFSGFDNVAIFTGPFSAQDVGTTAYVKVYQATPPITGTASPVLSVHSGSDEGDTIAIGIPAVSAQALRVANVSVLGGSKSDPTLSSQDAIGQVDFALATVLGTRAQLGAFIVRLTEDGGNEDTEATQMQAAESQVRDANVPADTAALALTQTEVQIDVQVLAQAQNIPQEVLKLFR